MYQRIITITKQVAERIALVAISAQAISPMEVMRLCRVQRGDLQFYALQMVVVFGMWVGVPSHYSFLAI